MDLEQLMTQMTQMFAGGLGNMLKKPVIVTDRYIAEHYYPEQVKDLSLERLDYNNNRVSSEVKILIIRKCDLQNIPKWIYDLKDIEGLLLDNNPNLNLTNKINNFKKLKVLGLQQTSINDYNFIESLLALESIDISGNYLHQYPKELCSLVNLLYLDISTYNKFNKIPSCIKNNKKLRVLRAHFNNIVHIPEEIGLLKDLEQLILGGNNIYEIPNTIYHLKNLKELDLFKNNIKKIDLMKLSKLKDLDEIFLSENPIDNFPDDLLDQDKGVLSSLALRKYYSTGIYYEISKERSNDELQISRLLRSARAIIFRGLFLGLKKDWKQAYNLVHSGYSLARDLKNNKLAILSAVFLGYLEILKEENNDNKLETFLKASEWATEINKFWSPYEDEKYRKAFNLCVIKYAQLTELDIAHGYRQEQDFELLLDKLFSNNYNLIKINEEDEMTHSMLYGLSSSDHPTKVENARNDINNRDLLRAYIELGLFVEAWNEIARQYTYQRDEFPITTHFPSERGEIYIYIFQLTNRDKLRILVANNDHEIILFDLDSISINLNKITTRLLESSYDKYLPDSISKSMGNITTVNITTVEEDIWNSIFGSFLINKRINKSKIDMTTEAMTFHQYCMKKNISKINIFPFASLLGVSFYPSYNSDKEKYLVDYYEVTNRPMFVLSNSFKSYPSNNDNIVVATHSDLVFAVAESKILGKYYKTVCFPIKSNKEHIFKQFENANIIHIASHSKESEILLKVNNVELSINAHEIKLLDLRKCNLVFLNACKTSEEAYVSLISTSSLPLAFLEAGANSVITTTSEIEDNDAFRISMRFYEVFSNTRESYSTIFRQIILESKKNILPYYEDELEIHGEIDLSSNMKYLKKYNVNKEMSSWKNYTIWDNNYYD